MRSINPPTDKPDCGGHTKTTDQLLKAARHKFWVTVTRKKVPGGLLSNCHPSGRMSTPKQDKTADQPKEDPAHVWRGTTLPWNLNNGKWRGLFSCPRKWRVSLSPSNRQPRPWRLKTQRPGTKGSCGLLEQIPNKLLEGYPSETESRRTQCSQQRESQKRAELLGYPVSS